MLPLPACIVQVSPHADDAITGTSIVPCGRGPSLTRADSLKVQRQAAMIFIRDQTWLHCPNDRAESGRRVVCSSPPRITNLLILLQTSCGLRTPACHPGFCYCPRRHGYGPTNAVPSTGMGWAVKALSKERRYVWTLIPEASILSRPTVSHGGDASSVH